MALLWPSGSQTGYPPSTGFGKSFPMRCLFWNIRGFGRSGRRTLLKDYLRSHKIDIVILQETIKHDFTTVELNSLDVGERFVWCWLAAQGHFGGMLVGCRDNMLEVGAINIGQFFISVQLMHRPTRNIFEMIGVYGPVDHGRSRLFLEELSDRILNSTRPLVVGGDFNLLRSAADNNNNNLNWPLIDRFNDYIAAWALQEIPRTSVRFTCQPVK
jgi:exonuclease III